MLVAMYPKGPVIPTVRAEQAAAQALEELTDEQFVRVVEAHVEREEDQSKRGQDRELLSHHHRATGWRPSGSIHKRLETPHHLTRQPDLLVKRFLHDPTQPPLRDHAFRRSGRQALDVLANHRVQIEQLHELRHTRSGQVQLAGEPCPVRPSLVEKALDLLSPFEHLADRRHLQRPHPGVENPLRQAYIDHGGSVLIWGRGGEPRSPVRELRLGKR